MKQIRIKKLHPAARIPEINKFGSGGFNLFSNEEEIFLKPGESYALKTDIIVEIPEYYVGFIWAPAGEVLKTGLHSLSGIIDANFRENIVIVVLNTSKKVLHIPRGHKIAQLLIMKVENFHLVEGDTRKELDDFDLFFGR